MKKPVTVILCLAASCAFAQASTPVGLWRSVDDRTGEAKAEIRIVDQGGELSGRIEKVLKKGGKPTCEECRDERKGAAIQGLEIIRAAKKADAQELWEHGRILDPENGKEYSLRLAPLEAGQKLQVRGYLGPFYRTQTWVRVQ